MDKKYIVPLRIDENEELNKLREEFNQKIDTIKQDLVALAVRIAETNSELIKLKER